MSLGREEGEGRGERAGWVWAGFTVSLVPQIKKAEMDRKTLDWEIVELTNKLLDARNTINKLEELNVRSPQGPPCLCCHVLALPFSPGLCRALNCICVRRSGTGWTATWLCSS